MSIFTQRIHHLQQLITELKIDLLLVENLINLYYLTGLELSVGRLLVARDKAYLIVDGRYYEKCVNESPVETMLSSKTNLKDLVSQMGHSTIRFEGESTTYRTFQELQQELPEVTLTPCSSPVKTLRMVKDETEIELLREAAQLGSEGYDFVLTQLTDGVSEEEVATELEIFWKKRGGKKAAFDPIIAFGANTSMPHYRAGKARLQQGDAVLIDIGVVRQGYHSDMTRMFFFGDPHPKIQEIYLIVKEAQRKALELCRPEITTGALDEAARDFIKAKGYGEHFMHSLGHGVGLEIHEAPTLRNIVPYRDQPLKAGMVITIEPGIYLPNIGGVRLEDTVLITEKGYENLTNRPL